MNFGTSESREKTDSDKNLSISNQTIPSNREETSPNDNITFNFLCQINSLEESSVAEEKSENNRDEKNCSARKLKTENIHNDTPEDIKVCFEDGAKLNHIFIKEEPSSSTELEEVIAFSGLYTESLCEVVEDIQLSEELKREICGFKCSLCNYVTDSKTNFQRHLLSDSETTLLKGAICKYESFHRDKHVQRHTKKTPLLCPHCNYETFKKKTFRKHLKKHSVKDSSYSTTGKSELDPEYNCPSTTFCGKDLKIELEEKSNRLSCEGLNSHSLDSKVNLIQCCQCDYKTSSMKNLKIHELNHSNIRLYKCSTCSYQTNRKGDLRTHVLIHSETKLYHCHKCDYETNSKRYLNIHLLNHTNIKLFKCSECSYETNRKADLTAHSRNHNTKKLFQCLECEYETNTKRYFKAHVLDHSGIKLFKCTDCNYETNRKVNLKNHSLVHMETKLFGCSQCSYGTNCKKYLDRHLLKHILK